MSENSLFGSVFNVLSKAVKISQHRHNVISGNISKVDAPGYSARDVDFQSTLESAMRGGDRMRMARTHPDHIGGPAGGSGLDLKIREHMDPWNGFNGVDIDLEIGRLMENNLIYRTSIEALLRKITILRDVIREGGR